VRAPRLGLVLVLAATAAAALPAQTPVFHSVTDSITVDVSVRQRGKPVPGLTTRDFELRDNGVVQPIADLTREEMPIDITLVVDVSASLRGPLLVSLYRSVDEIGRQLRPTDRARLISFSQRVRELGQFTGRLPDAAASLGPPGGETSLFDAIALAVVRPPEEGHRQMAIVFTDGRDNLSFLNETDVTAAAARGRMALFFVAVTDGTRARPLPSPHEKFFNALAETTGGMVEILQNDEDLGPTFLRALSEFRTSYVLRYTRAGGVEPGWHDLAVRVTRSGSYDVRARKGYFGSR
jgi:VWFA-related protein